MADSGGISYKRPPGWLRGWRLMVTLTVIAVMLVVFTLMTILLCSGDLRPVIERAKKDGLPTTWAELGLLTNPRHAALMGQMQALVSANKSYEHYPVWISFGEFRLGRGPGYGEPGEVLPDGLITVVTSRTDDDRGRMRQLINELDMPFRPGDVPHGLKRNSGFDLQRKLFVLELEDFFVNPSQDQAVALLDYSRSFGPDSMYKTICRLSVLDTVARACRFHLDKLRGDPGALVVALRAQAEELSGLMIPTSRAEFVRMSEIIAMDPSRYVREQGMALSAVLENPLGMALVHRIGRVTALDHVREFAVAAAMTKGFPDVEMIYPRYPPERLSSVLEHVVYQTKWEARFLCWWLPIIRMRLLVTAAALDGAAWPEDACSPVHAAVHELRDSTGQCYAVYSVSFNGSDDGGGKGDKLIRLRRSADERVKAALPGSMPPGMSGIPISHAEE